MDITRIDNSTKCYISVSKFEAIRELANANCFTDLLFLYIDNARNTYSTIGDNNVFQSTMIESFQSNSILLKNLINYSTFSYIANQDKWIEFNINNLNSLKISFKNTEINTVNFTALAGELVYTDIDPVDTFIYSLSLNIKFE
jgi:hypothetical protein